MYAYVEALAARLLGGGAGVAHFRRDEVLEADVAVVPAAAATGERALTLLKPRTMMNLSGLAVGRLLRRQGLPAAARLVVLDDVALPFGALRLRATGSAGGHNGLKDITERLGTERYWRLRVGVGAPAGGAPALVDHVLSEWDKSERAVIAEVRHRAPTYSPM